METRLITKFRIFKLLHESVTPGHNPSWEFKPLVGEENHEFATEAEAHQWVLDNPEIMIRCREFMIVPVYHLVLA
jgi:hypothetical protein